MCLKENYSDSPSNEYSRHYSAKSESECLRRQNMNNSKLGEEQKKKGHHVRRSPNFESNSDKKQKKDQNDNGLILGRVLGLDSAHPYYSTTISIGPIGKVHCLQRFTKKLYSWFDSDKKKKKKLYQPPVGCLSD